MEAGQRAPSLAGGGGGGVGWGWGKRGVEGWSLYVNRCQKARSVRWGKEAPCCPAAAAQKLESSEERSAAAKIWTETERKGKPAGKPERAKNLHTFCLK